MRILLSIFLLIIAGSISFTISQADVKATAGGTEMPIHTIAENDSLAPKNGRRIEIHVNNTNLTKDECRALINTYRKKAGPEGQVGVHKPSPMNENRMFPWCVDNMDEKGIFFQDYFFE